MFHICKGAIYFVELSLCSLSSPQNSPLNPHPQPTLLIFSSSKFLFLVIFLVCGWPKPQSIDGQGYRVPPSLSGGGKRNSFHAL